jgi:hypothetical protein
MIGMQRNPGWRDPAASERNDDLATIPKRVFGSSPSC